MSEAGYKIETDGRDTQMDTDDLKLEGHLEFRCGNTGTVIAREWFCGPLNQWLHWTFSDNRVRRVAYLKLTCLELHPFYDRLRG